MNNRLMFQFKKKKKIIKGKKETHGQLIGQKFIINLFVGNRIQIISKINMYSLACEKHMLF
jgi:hypothetical protein